LARLGDLLVGPELGGPKSCVSCDSACAELGDPLIVARNALLEAPDLPVHAQRHLEDHLTSCVVDGFRLSAAHAWGFDVAGLCPLTE
jgi:hypothetical protein